MGVHRHIILAWVVGSMLVAPLRTQGDDLADVRAVFDKDIRLFNAQNAEAFSGSAHDGVVLFGVLSPFATKGKDNLRKLVLFRPVNPEFAIIGTSAVAWGSYTITEYPKIGPREAIHGRYTFTYTKMDSKWLLAALHLSPLQGH